MSVLIQMCFISVVGGYVNVAQITSITELAPSGARVYVVTPGALELNHYTTGDKTAEDFLKRIQETCGGKRG